MKKRIALLLLVAIISIMAFAGCVDTVENDFPKTYVQGILDTLYLGQYNSDFLEITDYETSDPLVQEYESGMMTEVDYFGYYFDVSILSDAAKADLAELYKEIYSFSKYEVNPSVNEQDVYTVEVVVSPIDIIQKVVQEDMQDYITSFQRLYEEGTFEGLSEEEYEDLYVSGIIALIRDRLPGLGYLEAQTVTVRVVKNEDDGLYYIKDDGLAQIDQHIIQY